MNEKRQWRKCVSESKANRKRRQTVTQDGDALRCHCGSLVARLVPNGVEIKCRRCKRRIVIPLGISAVERITNAAFSTNYREVNEYG